MELLALIPARGGSKGVPRKNIREFCGRPLLAYSVDAAKGSKYVKRVHVNTEDEEIAKVARECGAEVPFMRPAEFAQDKSKVVDAVIHHLDTLKQTEGYDPSHILLLQVTSPMRTSEDIDRAVELFEARQADCLVSLCRTESLLMTKDKEDVVTLLPNDLATSSNRQENPVFYKFDGCMIYIIKTEVLRRERSFFAGKVVGYEIERWRSTDIDEPQDFIVGELIYKNRKEIEQALKNFS